jgi:hypothetical protein
LPVLITGDPDPLESSGFADLNPWEKSASVPCQYIAFSTELGNFSSK